MAWQKNKNKQTKKIVSFFILNNTSTELYVGKVLIFGEFGRSSGIKFSNQVLNRC